MHDAAPETRRPLIGVTAYPSSSLSNRAVAYLEAGPAASGVLVRDVLGLAHTPRAMVERIATALVSGDPRVTRTGDGRWTLAAGASPPSPTLDACRFAVVDVEATGTSPTRGHRIIEIAVATSDGGKGGKGGTGGGEGGEGGARLAYQTLVNPAVPIGPFVARLTGITDELVRDAPRFDRVADEVLGALVGAVFVAHHARFDWAFLCAELLRSRALLLAGPQLCTVRLARRLLPPLPSRSLEAVARYLGFEIERRHRAGPDAMAAARILGRLLDIAKEQGAVTLADLGKVPSAECGVRNVSGRVQGRTPSHFNSAPRTPHSALD